MAGIQFYRTLVVLILKVDNEYGTAAQLPQSECDPTY